MTTLTQLPIGYVQNPHELHDLLRAEGPVCELRLVHGLKAWLVTRYDEAKIALTDTRISKNILAGGELFQRHADPDSDRRMFDQVLTSHMLNTDPPNHTRLRKLVSKAFTARRIELMRPRVEEIAAELLDRMHGEVDLLDAFAFPLPITVICELLGVPVEDRAQFREWSGILLSYSSPEDIARASAGMTQCMNDMVDAKLAQPGDDFFSALVHADESGDRLSREELISMAFLLLVAGHETTVNLIGNAVYTLLRNPDQLERLKNQPELIPASTEEFLRHEGPVNMATFRYTLEPVEIGGVTIPADELVMVSLIAANRDGERFADPNKLDVTRGAGGHLAFGHGIHYCLGAPLARLEFEVALKGLLARFPDITLAAPPQELVWRDSSLIRGLMTLPVRLSS